MSVQRPTTADRPGTAGSRGSSPQRPGTSGSAWIPPGVRPHSPARRLIIPQTGTRRNRAVEHMHAFLDNKDLPPEDPANFCWLYGAFDYKLQTPHEVAREAVFKTVDRLVDRMNRMNPPPPPPTLESFKQRFGSDSAGGVDDRQSLALGIGGSASDGNANLQSQPSFDADTTEALVAAGKLKKPPAPIHRLKGCLIFDIISTKKHIGPVPTEGLPHRLGIEIYKYIDEKHGGVIMTSFVGMTDNTARRVGRDMYYTKSDDLSKNHIGFDMIDREHLHIIFPPEVVPKVPEVGDPTNTGLSSLLGNKSGGTRLPGIGSATKAPRSGQSPAGARKPMSGNASSAAPRPSSGIMNRRPSPRKPTASGLTQRPSSTRGRMSSTSPQK